MPTRQRTVRFLYGINPAPHLPYPACVELRKESLLAHRSFLQTHSGPQPRQLEWGVVRSSCLACSNREYDASGHADRADVDKVYDPYSSLDSTFLMRSPAATNLTTALTEPDVI